MHFLKINLLGLIILASFALVPVISFAQTGGGGVDGCNPEAEICNPVKYNTINEFLKVILEGVIRLGIPVIALAVIYSGFLFVTAMGNPEKLTKAKEALLYTLIGAAILLGSWAIAQLISETVLSITS